MFERYTEKARRIIFFGRYEASQSNSREIRPDHLMLGILREDAALFRALGVDQHAREQLKAAIRKPPEPLHKLSVSLDFPLSVSAKRVLAYAAEECHESGYKDIRPAHLLLAVLREDQAINETLKKHGVVAEKIRILLKPAGGASGPQPLQLVRELQDALRKVESRLDSDVEPAPVYRLSPPRTPVA